MRLSRRRAIAMLAAAIPLSIGNVAARQATPYAPVIDPARFTAIIDNRYLPLAPGTIFTYEGTSGGRPSATSSP